MTRRNRWLAAIFLCLLFTAVAPAQDLASFEKRITVETLDNGLTFIIMERPVAPVFSFFTHVDVGSAQEVPGITGLAHMFEHMAFKGTDQIGTTDYQAEKAALERVEEAWRSYDLARRRDVNRDEQEIERLKKEFDAAMEAANAFVIANEFGEIIDRRGGVGLNAFTSNDETGYFFSMPANQIELWAYLESERYLQPVMREFYKERDVVMEERRMRTESQPIGRLVEQFLAAAFTAHPYGQPVVGWPSDLRTFSATDAMEFYRQYYVPSNMVIAVVGDVKKAEVLPLIRRYFSRLPRGEEPEPLRTIEPEQNAERIVILRDPSQPFYIEGYKKPAITHPDNAVFDAIQDLLSSGRTSRLYRALVRDKKIAAVSSGFNNFPGEKYASMFAFFAVPTPGHTPDEMRDAIRAEIERLKTEEVSAEELQMVKTRAKANLLRQMRSNQGLAIQLASHQTRFGDWRELFRQVEAIDKVTPADIRRVANETFVDSNRTVGLIESTQMAGAAQGGAQ
ncbi:MAG TPA: pitrilysin family protein [Thermoanaerobaculia bacterium]|nr:pitrilysin family protein [Thermoanaerobaculia bacterium]